MALIERLVLASGNEGKLAELTALLRGPVDEIVPQSYYYVPEAAETGTTFVENALIKARNAAAHTRLPAIADDSGLEIPALDGAP
ncbi:non-canonical purine NTP pyrophosphatase, partial [Spiribacter roseus]